MKIRNKKQRFAKVYKLCEGIKKCDVEGGCGHVQPKFTRNGLRIMVEHNDDNFD